MEISFCIPTNGRESLYRLLSSISTYGSNSGINYEIIIANSTNNLNFSNAKVIFNKKGSAIEGRNICAYNAKGKNLVFIDDDCYLSQDYFDEIGKIISKNNFFAFAGYTEQIRDNSLEYLSWLDAGFDKYFLFPKKMKFLRWATASNFIIDKQYFFKNGGFSELLNPVGGEDVDFGIRFIKNGFGPIKSCPSLRVFHQTLEENNCVFNLLKKAKDYGIREQFLGSMYPEFITTKENLSSFENSGLVSKFKEAFQEGRLEVNKNPVNFSLSKAANVQNNLDERLALMIIKPYGIKYEKEILNRLNSENFLILESIKKVLSYEEIFALYIDSFNEIKSKRPENSDEYIKSHISYLSASESLILFVYQRGENISYENIKRFRGKHFRGDLCDSGSIRRDFLGDGDFNTFHSSINFDETMKHIKIFNFGDNNSEDI